MLLHSDTLSLSRSVFALTPESYVLGREAATHDLPHSNHYTTDTVTILGNIIVTA